MLPARAPISRSLARPRPRSAAGGGATARRFVLVLFFAVLFALPGGYALAQTGIRLSTTVDGLPPPASWYAVIPGTRQYQGERTAGWGLLETPPGQYEVVLHPEGGYSLPVSFGRVTVAPGQVAEVEISSAIRFEPDSPAATLEYWRVLDDRGEAVAQVVGEWGIVALPPGRYRVETAIPGREVRSPVKSLSPGSVLRFGPSDLGIARLEVGLPDLEQTGFLFGGEEFIALLGVGEEFYDLREVERENGGVGLWMEARDDVLVEFRHGGFAERIAPALQPGAVVAVPFDLEAITAKRGHAIVSFETSPGAAAADRVQLLAAGGSRALLSDPNFDLGKTYLVPGLSTMTVTSGGQTTRHGPFPSSERTIIDTGSFRSEAAAGPGPVSIVIESPASGTALPVGTAEVRVIGDASAIGTAGTTKVVLIMDVSASTEESAGRDADGDGETDSVLDAEIAAADSLIGELAALDAENAGTAYAVGIVAFGETAQVLMPLTPLASPEGAAVLRNTISGLTFAMQGADTFYDRGLDAAHRLLEGTALPGPSAAILVTDGKPSQIAPGIDAAARLGDAQVPLHTIGLGADFRGAHAPALRYPPLPRTGPEILASIAAFGAEGGQVWLLPDPADVVRIVSELPVVERADAGIARVMVRNETTGEEAQDVALSSAGAFEATVPIGLDPANGIVVNLITAEAFADTVDGAERSAEAEVRLVVEGVADELAAARERERDALARQIAALSDAAAGRAAELEARIGELSAARDREQELRREAERAREAAEAAAARARLAALPTGEIEACRNEMRQCRSDLAQALDAVIPVQPGPGGDVLSFPGDVLFDFAESELRDDAEAILELAALYIRDNKRADVIVEGHTDRIGSAEDNRALSLARAEAVEAWLIEAGVVAQDQIRAIGYGEDKPREEETFAGGSDNPEARQRNRRVEIRLLR